MYNDSKITYFSNMKHMENIDNTPMNIAYLSTFYPLRGGIAQFNASLLHAFQEQNHPVSAYTFTRQYPKMLFPGKSQYVTPDDPAIPISSIALLDTMNPISYYRTASAIAQNTPHLLVMKFWMPFFAPSLGTVAKQLRKNSVKVISILDNVIPHERRLGDMALIRYFLRQNDGFIVMSETVKQDLLTLRPSAPFIHQSHPLYNHFGRKIEQNKAREQLNIPINKKILLFFGFIRSYKGLDILLQALPLLPEDYNVVIAGEVYGDFTTYQDIITEHSLQDRVHIHVRYINDTEVPLFFSASDLCVLPYRSATQSGIVPIAYHFDLPVVITDTGSLGEMVAPYGTGLIASDITPIAIAETIQQYFNGNLELRCKHSILQYKQQHSWAILAGRITEFYKHL